MDTNDTADAGNYEPVAVEEFPPLGEPEEAEIDPKGKGPAH